MLLTLALAAGPQCHLLSHGSGLCFPLFCPSPEEGRPSPGHRGLRLCQRPHPVPAQPESLCQDRAEAWGQVGFLGLAVAAQSWTGPHPGDVLRATRLCVAVAGSGLAPWPGETFRERVGPQATRSAPEAGGQGALCSWDPPDPASGSEPATCFLCIHRSTRCC